MGGGSNILSTFQLSTSHGLGVKIFEGLEEKDELLTNELMSNGGVCRTALATEQNTHFIWYLNFLIKFVQRCMYNQVFFLQKRKKKILTCQRLACLA